jgi:hypothetical protein
MNITEIDKPKVKRTIVVYGGRFQPFHKGHYAAYKSLVNKFGAGNVFIGSSNVTSQPKSPFNFQEKKRIATTLFDIPSNRFVMIKNPYNPVEILSKFDGDTTQYVAAVGEKDAERLGGDYFKPYKGKAGYGYNEIGYIYLIPPQANAISGTDVRQNIGGEDEKKAIDFFKKAYPKYDKGVFNLIRKRLVNEDINVGVDVGDTVLMGKFKNKEVKVRDIASDSHGMPTINGKQATTFRTMDESEIYNPIFKIIGETAAKEIFEQFISDYLGEAELENPNAADLLNQESYVPTTGMFNRKLSVQQKIDKLNPARAIEKAKIWNKTFSHHNPKTGEIEDVQDSKTESINHFVEYATNRLKLSERPKIHLVGGGEYAESQTSLGGYDDNTKEIFVSTEGRLTADILRTIAHEMVHRKQDEMGIIKDRTIDGKTGSEVENKAHVVAGILMREYGKINKKIFQEGVVNEASSIQNAFNDDQPDGMFLAKGMKRKLGAADGINKSDEWFTNGGYIQIDFPTADTIFGDDEQDQPYVIWRVKNLPRTDFKPTKFNKKNFVNEHRVVSLLKEGGAYGHMSHPFDDMGLTFGDLKRIISGALNGRLELAREKCIAADSIIYTEKNGDMTIAEFVDNGIVDKVLAFNDETGKNEYMDVMASFNNDTTDEWLEIELEDGKTIQVTPNHRIYVKGVGYIEAKDLTEDMELKTL